MGGPIAGHSQQQDVRILLVGEGRDEIGYGVGKTSLILSLIGEEFPELVPARIEEVTIPADVTPERVPTHIIDYSARSQDGAACADELRRANVICVVYAVDKPDTFDKVTSYWLPLIDECVGREHSVPVILVGNRCDLLETSNLDQILPLMNQYPQIETCVECSAKQLKNISELFYYAQKAVLHPTGPLYVAEEKELTQMCKKALVRIFKLSDADNDGLLNDYELNQFQQRCFNVPLTPDALSDVKAVVKKNVEEGVINNFLTLKGFLYLHMLFIQRGRHETTWTVLRRFGYDRSMQLAKDYLFPPLVASADIKVPRGCTTELSFDGSQFLAALFEKYDEDRDNCLAPDELTNLFSVCASQPWGNEVLQAVETNHYGYLTYNGFMSQWAYLTLMDLTRTLEYLAYLGFNVQYGSQQMAVTVTRNKQLDWQHRDTKRAVFHCHVIGAKDAGKSAFMQGFLGRDLKQQAASRKQPRSSSTTSTTPSSRSTFVTNSIRVHDQVKYIVLHEIDVLDVDSTLTAYELSCDVAVFVYDVSNPHSFEYCAAIYKKHFHRTRVPCLFVASKADRPAALQSYEYQPDEFTGVHRLLPPIPFTSADVGNRHATVYSKLALLAVHPHLKHVPYLHDSSVWIKLGIGAAVLAAFGFAVLKNI